MRSLFHHIERVRAQPHHIRRRVALGVSSGVTGLIALVWFVGSVSSGSFAISHAAYGDTSGTNASVAVVQPDTSAADTGIAGAAAALPAPDTSVPAHIDIVAAPAATTSAATDQTVIPF